MSSNKSGWPSPDAENRPSNEPIGERALQTEPDAQQGNVEVVGGHQRSHHRQLCLQQAANSRVQHRRSELTGLEDRTQAPPARRRFVKQVPTKTKAHDQRKKDSDLEPEPCRYNLANRATSLVDTVPTEETGQRHAYPSSERRKHRTTPSPDEYAARQAADLCK